MASSGIDPKIEGSDNTQPGEAVGSIKDSGRGIFRSIRNLFAGLGSGVNDALEHQIKPVITRSPHHAEQVNRCEDFDEIVRRDMSDLRARVADEVIALSTHDADQLAFALRQAMSFLVAIRQDLHTNCNIYTIMYRRALAEEVAIAQGKAPTDTSDTSDVTAKARLDAIIAASDARTPRPSITAHKVISMPDLRKKKKQRTAMVQEMLSVCERIREVADQVALDVVHVDSDHYVTLDGVIDTLENLADYLKDREDYFRVKFKVSSR